jgi:hypothetical protein
MRDELIVLLRWRDSAQKVESLSNASAEPAVSSAFP